MPKDALLLSTVAQSLVFQSPGALRYCQRWVMNFTSLLPQTDGSLAWKEVADSRKSRFRAVQIRVP